METLEVEELDKQWGIKEAKMIIFSSRIIKSNEYGHPSCRQVQILNGNHNGDCMVLSNFNDGLKQLNLRRQKDYKVNTTTTDSIFTCQGPAAYDSILRQSRQIHIAHPSLLVHHLTKTFYDEKTQSIITIFKSQPKRGVHRNIGVYKYSMNDKKANIISYISGSIEKNTECSFYALLGNDQVIYGITIHQRQPNPSKSSMIIKMYRLGSSGWIQEGRLMEISSIYYEFDAQNMVIIDRILYLFGSGQYVYKNYGQICITCYDPEYGYGSDIAILNFNNGNYELKKEMMHGEILYAAIPFGFGCRYIALYPDRYHYESNHSTDPFHNHPIMYLFDSWKKTMVKLSQKVPRSFYCFIAYYAEDYDGFIRKDIAELVVYGWIRNSTWKQLDMSNWPMYLSKVALTYYFSKPKVGICGLNASRSDPTQIVYVSIPFDLATIK